MNSNYLSSLLPLFHEKVASLSMEKHGNFEMCIWDTIGDFLDGSDWTSALCEAGIATTGTADSILKASHLTRTRRAHQITAVVVSKKASGESSDENTLMNGEIKCLRKVLFFHFGIF